MCQAQGSRKDRLYSRGIKSMSCFDNLHKFREFDLTIDVLIYDEWPQEFPFVLEWHVRR